MRKLAAILSFTVMQASAATADWQRASSPHFVVYANEPAKELRDFAVKLETFDKAVRHAREMSDPAVGDGNRVTVYVVPSASAVQQLYGDHSGSVYGYYSGRATGSLAVVPRDTGAEHAWELGPQPVFFHEYAHHLMFSALDTPYPEWLIEGFAEFMSTAKIGQDGSVGLGLPPQFRAMGLFYGANIRAERLLAGDFARMTPMERETAYGRSWLLAHYLTFTPGRSGQLDTYVAEMAKGTDSVAAGRKAFGDFKLLDHELDHYMVSTRMQYLKMTNVRVDPAAVSVVALSPGGAAVMNDRIRSKVGVNATTAEPLAVRVRAIEHRFPGDLLVERTLAEAELDAHHPDASLAAAERALKTDSTDNEAALFEGRAIMAGSAPDRFVKARRLFIAANRRDTEDPKPLMYFYQSFVREGVPPNANAIAALHYASNLAPQDGGLRLTSALQYLSDHHPAEARETLVPVAYNPHGEKMAVLARTLIARIDAGDADGAIKLARADDLQTDDKSKK